MMRRTPMKAAPLLRRATTSSASKRGWWWWWWRNETAVRRDKQCSGIEIYPDDSNKEGLGS